jgi:DNA-binding NtrC family response regulator
VSDRPGLLEQAHRGTLFLDEVGEMSLRMQAALLRFLETGEVRRVGGHAAPNAVDVRVCTATNRDLRRQVADGAFREDLFYRLNVIQIQVPPLRERGDDIVLLLRHFISESALANDVPEPTVSPDAAQLLVGYAWPGNIRELKNVAERLVLYGQGEITPVDLPGEIRGTTPPHRSMVRGARQRSTSDDRTASPARGHIVDEVWNRLLAGGNFWELVGDAYRARYLSRSDLRELVDRGLRETGGSYRSMVKLFNLERSEYKRFHAFLYQARCNLPVAPYRKPRVVESPQDRKRPA